MMENPEHFQAIHFRIYSQQFFSNVCFKSSYLSFKLITSALFPLEMENSLFLASLQQAFTYLKGPIPPSP